MRLSLPPYLLSSVLLHGAAVTGIVATSSAPRFPKPPHSVELVTLPPPAPKPPEAPPPKVPEPEPVKEQPKPRAPMPAKPAAVEPPRVEEPEAAEPAAPEPVPVAPALAALGDSAVGLPVSGLGRAGPPSAGRGRRSPSVDSKPAPPAPRLVRLADLSQKPQPPSFDGALRANYPDALRRQGTEGQATLRLTLSSRGRVVEARVLSQSHQEFGAACRRTLLGSQWSVPLDGEGRPTGTALDYRCRFRVGS